MIPHTIKGIKFEIPSDLDEVKGATSRLRDFLGVIELTEGELFDLRLSFEEALINAIKYGNRRRRDIPVSIEVAFNDREIFIAVEDRGNGFDPDRLKDPTEDENIEETGGRGVYLLRHLMDRVAYNARGNRVEMVKRYARGHPERKDLCR